MCLSPLSTWQGLLLWGMLDPEEESRRQSFGNLSAIARRVSWVVSRVAPDGRGVRGT